jgi:hypothetical protein
VAASMACHEMRPQGCCNAERLRPRKLLVVTYNDSFSATRRAEHAARAHVMAPAHKYAIHT